MLAPHSNESPTARYESRKIVCKHSACTSLLNERMLDHTHLQKALAVLDDPDISWDSQVLLHSHAIPRIQVVSIHRVILANACM